MSFSEYLASPDIAERYNKIKPFFRLRQSGYDVTSRCQLRCNGCFYFQGDKSQLGDVEESQQWRQFFIDEKNRGINHVNLAGAEPAIVPDILQAAWDVIPQGVVFSNGIKRIDSDLGFRIHLSVWGDAEGDLKYRGVNCLPRQLKNYRHDSRAVFVYTFNRFNIEQIDRVAEQIVGEGHPLTFNFFSSLVGEQSNLSLDVETNNRVRYKIEECIDKYGNSILFSLYGAQVHTNRKSLYQKFGCPFPRASARNLGGVKQRYRNYRTDLSHDISTDCCVPDTDCNDCRHYVAGSAIISASMNKHLGSEEEFRGWLDYLDNYLATWINGYEKSASLYFGA